MPSSHSGLGGVDVMTVAVVGDLSLEPSEAVLELPLLKRLLS